jgi:hypothetical protein
MYFHNYYHPMQQQNRFMLIPEMTVEDYIPKCQGQYIRSAYLGKTIVGRLLAYIKATGMVQIDIAFPSDLAGFTEIHRNDLVGISCLGPVLPPQYQTMPTTPTTPTMPPPPQRCSWRRNWYTGEWEWVCR